MKSTSTRSVFAWTPSRDFRLRRISYEDRFRSRLSFFLFSAVRAGLRASAKNLPCSSEPFSWPRSPSARMCTIPRTLYHQRYRQLCHAEARRQAERMPMPTSRDASSLHLRPPPLWTERGQRHLPPQRGRVLVAMTPHGKEIWRACVWPAAKGVVAVSQSTRVRVLGCLLTSRSFGRQKKKGGRRNW